jgi:hypothetical protein
MKTLKTLKVIVVLILVSLSWTACKKEVSQPGIPQNQDAQNVRTLGAIEDNPDLISKVPLILSADFLAHNRQDFMNRRTVGGIVKGRGDKTAPTVSITSPSNGATVSGTINVMVSASDNVGVTSVTLSVDGSTVATSTTSPFTNSWNTGSVPNGTHTLTATAADAAGNKGSSSIQVTVSNVSNVDLTSPTASITSPANNSSFDPNVSVTVNVNASDNVGVSSISLSVDGTVIGSASGSTGSFSWNTGSVSGPHTLTAKAYDAAGNQGSTSISVTVNTIVLPPSTLPSSASIAMPAVQYQGAESACVSFAVLYTRDAEQYYKTASSSYSAASNIFSPEFLYDQTKVASSCSSGASLINSLNFLVNNGVCTWNSMPYSDQNGCSLVPTSQQTTEAAGYKIKSYSMVVAQDPTAIKTMLAANHPLSFTFTADANFYNATPGYIWNSYSSTLYGPHAIALVGYDDSKHAYRAINEWGTNWGDAGYIWIDYDFFATIAYDLYAITL